MSSATCRRVLDHKRSTVSLEFRMLFPETLKVNTKKDKNAGNTYGQQGSRVHPRDHYNSVIGETF